MPATGIPASSARRPSPRAALTAFALGVGLACCLPSCKSAPKPAPAPAAPAESFYDLDEFLVNLSNPGGDRYVRTTISLGFTHEAARDAIKAELPRVRDAILAVLGGQTTDALVGLRGREKVKRDILTRLKGIVPSAGFDGVYFQLFTFQ